MLPLKIEEQQIGSLIQKTKEATYPDLSNYTVLVVEDNHINQLVVNEMLKVTDVKIVLAQDGFEALKQLSLYSIDLVLMDIQMPKMDGCEAMRQINQLPQYGHIPVLAMTANVMVEDVRKYLSLGMKAHIGKPINQQALYEVLAYYLFDDVKAPESVP
jgi:CheY-like chemotaxis protein